MKLQNVKFRTWALAIVNLLFISLMIGSASLIFRNTIQAAGTEMPENSIVYDGRLLDFSYAISGANIEATADGQATVYLVKSTSEVLAGADVAFEIPFLNYQGNLVETSPGTYRLQVTENATISVETSSQHVANWGAGLNSWSINDKSVYSLSFTDYVGQANLQANGGATTYEIPLSLAFEGQIFDGNGNPAANTTISLSLPNHNYVESVTTDENGWVRYQRDEIILLTVRDGVFDTISQPLSLPPASPLEFVAAWPGDPDPTPTPQPSLCVSVSTSESTYTIGEAVEISGQTTDCDGAPVSGASVSITSTDPNGGTALSQSVSSNASGNFSVGYEAQSPQGTYQVSADASHNGDSDSASTSYEIEGEFEIELTLEDFEREVEVPYSSEPVKYGVYKRGETILTDIVVRPVQPLSSDADVTVQVELLKAGSSSPIDSQEVDVTVSGGEVTVDPPIEFALDSSGAVGYYEVKAVVLTTGSNPTETDEDIKDAAVIFNEATGGMASTFVDSGTATWGHSGGWGSVFDLSLDSAKLFKYSLDTIDSKTSATDAAQSLRSKTSFLQIWTTRPTGTGSVAGIYSSCDLESPSSDCAMGGTGQCQYYGNGLTSFLRISGIPARPVGGGVGSPVISAKDPNESPAFRHPDLEVPICWTGYHVWTEANLNGSWDVLDANQGGFYGSQNDYGQNYIDNYCAVAGQDFNPNGLSLGFFVGWDHGSLGAESLGGGIDVLDGVYGVNPVVTNANETEAFTSIAGGPSITNFQSTTYQLGDTLVLEIVLNNANDTAHTYELAVQIDGMAQQTYLQSRLDPPVTVFADSQNITVEGLDSQTVLYELPIEQYRHIGAGLFGARTTVDGKTYISTAQITGMLDLAVSSPSSVNLGDPFTVSAVITNPSDQSVNDIVVASENPAFEEQTIPTLGAGESATVSWTTTAAQRGRMSATVYASAPDAGETLVIDVINIDSPADLHLYSLDVPARVEIGEQFEITAHVWNPGTDPLADVAVSLATLPNSIISVDSPASSTVSELAGNGWATVSWQATALAPGRLQGTVSAVAGGLSDSASLMTIVSEAGHAVDLIIESTGDDVQGGIVIAEVPTAEGTNYARAGYQVFVENEGATADTYILSVIPRAGGAAAFDDNETRTRTELISLEPGEMISRTLDLFTWNDEASALVTVRSQGDLTQWDHMEVIVQRNDNRSLTVEPDQYDLVIEHGQSQTVSIEVINNSDEPLNGISLTPQGETEGWSTLSQTTIATLLPGETTTVDLTLAVPKYQAPDLYTGSVRVQSGNQSDAVLINIQVPESHLVVLDLSPEQLGVVPGKTGIYTAAVQNEGNVSDSYDLILTGLPSDWDSTWSRNPVIVEPGATANVKLLIIPLRSPDTKPSIHTFDVTAENSDTSDQDQANLEVLPFHDLGLTIDETGQIEAPPVVLTKVWKRANEQPHGRLDVLILTHGTATEADEDSLTQLGAAITRRFDIIDGLAGSIPASKLEEIAALSFVTRIELDETVSASQSVPPNIAEINVDDMYASGVDGSGVIVAIVDTGIDADHPSLPNQTAGYDFVNNDADPDDDHGHGTHVAGTVGANDATYPGVAPGAMLMPVKVLNAAGSGSSSDVIAGVEWAVDQGAHVINMSLGTNAAGDGTSALSQAVNNAVKSGVVVVVAAGNNGPDYETVGSPGDAALAITVGALNTSTTIADFSSRGPTLDGRVKPDILAPGVGINSTWIGGGYNSQNGTSMASPHVAGIAALLLDEHPVTVNVLQEALYTTAVPIPSYDSNSQGNGKVDGDAASAYIQAALDAASIYVSPGDTAVYSFTLKNLGNVADSFVLSTMSDDLPAAALIHPLSISGSWIELNTSLIDLASGNENKDAVLIHVPADWESMEDATYRFRLVGTSQNEPAVSETDLAFLSIEATKRSMIEYVELEIAWLMEDASNTPKPIGLLAILGNADGSVKSALEYVSNGDEIGTDTRLNSAINSIEAFVNQVEASRDKHIDITTADELIAKANLIISHLEQALVTDLVP